MPVETWYWTPPNGAQTPLSTAYWNVSTFGGSRTALPTLRGQDYEVPFRTGARWRPKYPNSRTLTLAMWVAGIDPVTGQPAADQMLAFNQNLSQLRHMFWTRDESGSLQGTLTRQWWLGAQGSGAMVTASGMAEIAGSMEPTMTGRTRADLVVDLLMADPYFYGPQRSQVITSSGAITASGDGVVGESYSSPVNGFTVRLTTSATITNVTAADAVTFTDPGGTAWPVTLDVINYTAYDNNGNNKIAGVSHAGARFWMALLPGNNSITVSAGSATFMWNDPYV